MATLDNGKFWLGVAVGLAVGTFGSRIGPLLAEASRPLIKALIKATILSSERGREIAAHLREIVEDATAEAHADLRTGTNASGAAGAAEPAPAGRKGVGSA